MKYFGAYLSLRRVMPFLVLLLGSFAFSNSYTKHWEDGDETYDRARRAVETGEILPMSKLLEHLHTQLDGEVIGVEFEKENGMWVYEFKLIDTKGRLLEVYIDPRTGDVISMEHD